MVYYFCVGLALSETIGFVSMIVIGIVIVVYLLQVFFKI